MFMDGLFGENYLIINSFLICISINASSAEYVPDWIDDFAVDAGIRN